MCQQSQVLEQSKSTSARRAVVGTQPKPLAALRGYKLLMLSLCGMLSICSFVAHRSARGMRYMRSTTQRNHGAVQTAASMLGKVETNRSTHTCKHVPSQCIRRQRCSCLWVFGAELCGFAAGRAVPQALVLKPPEVGNPPQMEPLRYQSFLAVPEAPQDGHEEPCSTPHTCRTQGRLA